VSTPRTLFEKVWQRHAVLERGDETLLYVDRNLVHEGSFHAFGALAAAGRTVRRPGQTFATMDHYVPTLNRDLGLKAIADPEIRNPIEVLTKNARTHGIRLWGMDDPEQGIVHVIGAELGITQPGITLTCGDSHTSTHGAFGALAFGVGASQSRIVLATQCLWVKKPRTVRITIDGALAAGVTAKDLILAIIARVGTSGATGCTIEYAGAAIRTLSMEGRMTVCNMSIEAGARAGMIAPDEVTFEYMHDREYAPRDSAWDEALRYWRSLPTDAGAKFGREVTVDATTLEPMVTWGTSPEQAAPISAVVPDPASAPDAQKRTHMEQALAYMDYPPGTRLDQIKIDRAFIGTCTNGRIEDLRAAAAVLKGRKITVPGWVSPGSTAVKRQAEAEGLDRVFREAGFEWRASGCSACAAMNADALPQGARCASTSNRNFEGRQGKGVRTHLMSPAMVAAAAVTGHLTDVRTLLKQ
jgi:3-isopropylmalate/(R)-2-methylmalate dehydratase large subunit